MIRQHIVTLVAVIYYTERLQSKITKAERPGGRRPGAPGAAWQGRASGVTQVCPRHTCEVVAAREARSWLTAQAFYWRLAVRIAPV